MNTIKVSIFRHSCFILFFLLTLGLTKSQAQLDEASGINSRLYYSGTLGSSEKIEFNMQVNGYAVTGSYMTVSTGDILLFKGRLAADKAGMGVLVYDENNNYIASIEASVISQELDFASELVGTWKSLKDGGKKNLSLTKVAEFAKAEESRDYSYFE